ncbi:hypothetical protein GCM10022223_02880 [Kineosporia mesophila]|uniref:LysM domain-containing protein n=1 Tax=Kineosporia mesophila TaxID=566012 RepID=A0ABP6YWA5_9ACTN|nr:LysM peptidoglycan-binding domain-containing protein [Kineosporia mesophila]MCD5351776.1 LysM peptidoglycan-binding domain-containing protein [Kineosporia mesophila]
MSQTYLSVSNPPSRGAALLLSALVLVTGLTLQLGRLTLGAWAGLTAPGPATPDQAFGLIASAAGTALTAWLLSALAVSTVAAAASRSRMAVPAARTARRIAPAAVRNAVAALLGVALIATPTVAQAATYRPMLAATAGAAASETGANGSVAGIIEPLPGARAAGPATADAKAGTTLALVRSDRTSAGTTAVTSTTHEAADPESPREKLLEMLSPGWTPERPRPTAASGSRAKIGVLTSTPRRAVREPKGHHVVVKRGDTLWSIAAQHLGPGASDVAIAHEWPRWYQVNRHLIGADPHKLLPGERLRSPDLLSRPAKPEQRTHAEPSGQSPTQQQNQPKEAGR